MTNDAVGDLRQLHRKDPQILRDVFAKMLLLESSPLAGEPLMGSLIGFRKLVVGNRDWRIIWRETQDVAHEPVLEIAEVWAAGARTDGEIYDEMKRRIVELEASGHEQAKPLSEVIRQLGRMYAEMGVHPEPELPHPLPAWLAQGLKVDLNLTHDEINALTEDQAKALMMEHWSKPQ